MSITFISEHHVFKLDANLHKNPENSDTLRFLLTIF